MTSMNIIKVLKKTCMKSPSRRGCVTLFFIIGLALYILDISVVSHEIHWWNNRNISFILNNLKLANSDYEKHSTAYLLYRILKTRINDVCAFPPDSLKSGHYRPPNCTPVQKVAIIVPYRDRQKQLQVFLNNMIPKLKRQKIEFTIYVIEQKSGKPFNRGMMANIGFKEAMSDMEFDCIVFHDVDVLPEDDRNFYICSDNPIHMSVKVEQFGYRLLYEKLAGGIITFSKEQFQEINGYSNQFFGWGGEDDDLYRRIKFNKYELIRPFEDFGICGSVRHEPAEKNSDRRKFLKYSHEVWKNDGLSNLKYSLLLKEKKQLYRWIYVSI
ncbi:beta-1,4-galactosyltransferase 6-like [Mytilus trossulus]|uniref:beta-1,4-galactosyltransferase 6-like n=1 Tax=Mytilus trossulus TaxID=6551 RepID=UPI0030062A93